MLFSTIEQYILLKFRRGVAVRIPRRKLHSCNGVGIIILKQRVWAGADILESSLLQTLSEKRKITRTGVYLALLNLTDSGYLTFFTIPNTLPHQRVFVLTEKGAHALNSGVLFKRAADTKLKDV